MLLGRRWSGDSSTTSTRLIDNLRRIGKDCWILKQGVTKESWCFLILASIIIHLDLDRGE